MTTKYIEISERNFKHFLGKGFIYPIYLYDTYDFLEQDLLTEIPYYIPVVTKDFGNNVTRIFLELKSGVKTIKLGKGIEGIADIIPFSKIKKIYISDVSVYENILNTNFSDIPIYKSIIVNESLTLKEEVLNYKEIKERKGLKEKLKCKLNSMYISLGGKQLLKSIGNKYYNDLIFGRYNEDLNLIYNYMNPSQAKKSINYSEILINGFLREKIRERSDLSGKDKLKELYQELVKIIKPLTEKKQILEEEVENLREKVGCIKKVFEEGLSIKKVLQSLDEEKDYGIIIYLILNKYGVIGDFHSFLNVRDTYFRQDKYKLLLTFLYGELIGYPKLFTELDGIKYKLDITDEYDNDIYEDTIDFKKIHISEQKEDGIKIKLFKKYGTSNAIVDEKIYVIKKEHIHKYILLEDELENTKNDTLILKEELKELNMENDNLQKELDSLNEENKICRKQIQNLKKKLQQIANISNVLSNETNGGTERNNQLSIG